MPEAAVAPTPMKLFVPINKIDEENRLVYGEAASETRDNSGEIFDYEGSKPYFQKWSDNAFATSGGKSHGNLRVMHTSKVAGIISSPLAFDDDAKTIQACAKVVDDDEWKKVLTGCYTGFSMGGRYVERVKKGDEQRYIADPVEISLVDKPCIPSATFSVVKADGIVEEHRFRDDLYIEKADNMTTAAAAPAAAYTPTNDEVLPVAQALAKAAGKTDADWLDFVEPATAQLIEKAAGGEAAAEEHDTEGCTEEDCTKCAAAKADNPFADKGKKKEGEDGDEEAEGEDEDGKGGKNKDAAAKADIVEAPEPEQGWRATDGSFHLKKADALAHNHTLANPPEPSVIDTLRDLNKVATAIANGEEVPASDPKDGSDGDDAAITDTEVGKYAGFLDGFEELNKAANPEGLVKGMYSVSRLANVLRDVGSLQISVSRSTKDGDGSTVAAQIGTGLGALGDALIDMAKEEVARLMSTVATVSEPTTEGIAVPYYDECYVELAASTLGLEKADFGAIVDGPVVELLQKRDVPALAVTDTPETLAKLDAAVTKADKLEAEFAEAMPLIKSLQTQLEAIQKMPMPKAPTTSFAKGDMPGGEASATTGLDLTKFTPDQLADAAIRISQRSGQHIVLPVGNSNQ